MKYKIFGIVIALGLAVALFAHDNTSLDERLKQKLPELESILSSRDVFVDPAEIMELVYQSNTPYLILDVRNESDFNLFHLTNSLRVTPGQIKDPDWVVLLPQKTALILVSNDELQASEAWKLLKVQHVDNLYILAGGINNWLDIYWPQTAKPNSQQNAGQLKHTFDAALGDRHPAANLDYHDLPQRTFTKKIKGLGGIAKKSGGCG